VCENRCLIWGGVVGALDARETGLAEGVCIYGELIGELDACMKSQVGQDFKSSKSSVASLTAAAM
jgi:hypothetical protein